MQRETGMSDGGLSIPVGQRIQLPGHFAEPVVLESVRPLGDGFECRVRLADGTPDEAVISREEAEIVFGRQEEAPSSVKPVDAESIRLLVESSRIRLAYTHDRHFAVSLSGIRTLPHQIEAVYLRMLPQPRLRFLLADDPGAGKTIMAGLLFKEMKLREASAYTKSSSTRGDEVDKTKRYQVAERLAASSDHILLLTATPHHGDDDRFAHFIRLIDSDLFPEPHRVGNQAMEIRRDILRLGPDCPWALRRLKEDLRDVRGRRLFPDRHAHTVAFKLSLEEFDLYKAVTAYINQFLPQASGRRQASVALARTVLQRRLASSTMAIYESIRRRMERQQDLLKELEDLTPAQRAKRLAQLQGRLADVEKDEDDLDDTERDQLADQFTSAVGLDQLRAEIAALQELLAQARRVRDHASDSKLAALKECLERAEFRELEDGRGRLLIFTEHRDTLNYLCEWLKRWGYTTCLIHGGMNPHERKRAQELFRVERQICVATEAAGEGINLQFCRLMINYDLPWNPTRLEQRLGRIHRIGQERDVHAFNFVASESEEGQPIIEGRILERLLHKMEQMRSALSDRVFDVIGEVLSLNDVNLPEILREAANDPRRLDEYLDQIERIDPKRLLQYEQATGIALARGNVDFSGFQTANAEAEERRLMPRYVEQHSLNAAREIGLRVEARADGLYRIEHVLADLRSDRLAGVRRLGKPESSYRKVTFHKEHLEMDQHIDAVLIGPGHPLYAAVDERLNEMLGGVTGQVGVFVDTNSDAPYYLHFFEMAVRGQNTKGEVQTLLGELVAVREELSNAEDRFSVVPADNLLDLPAHPAAPENIEPEDSNAAADFLKSTYQTQRRGECQQERQHFIQVCRDYLQQSFDARIRAAQDRVMGLRARESRDPDIAIARQRAENDLADLERTRTERLAGLQRLTLAKHGPVRHVATALVFPSTRSVEEQIGGALDDLDPEIRRRSEIAAEDVVIAHETTRGFECERVGHLKIGFDIRSIGPADPQTGYRDPVTGIRRIEVKGRRRGQPVRLTTNEWYKATQLGDSYWLYVVWNPLNSPDREPVMIQNPAKHLDHAKREIIAARYYDIPAEAIEGAAQKQRGLPL